jgi:hypothetical protein
MYSTSMRTGVVVRIGARYRDMIVWLHTTEYCAGDSVQYVARQIGGVASSAVSQRATAGMLVGVGIGDLGPDMLDHAIPVDKGHPDSKDCGPPMKLLRFQGPNSRLSEPTDTHPVATSVKSTRPASSLVLS